MATMADKTVKKLEVKTKQKKPSIYLMSSYSHLRWSWWYASAVVIQLGRYGIQPLSK